MDFQPYGLSITNHCPNNRKYQFDFSLSSSMNPSPEKEPRLTRPSHNTSREAILKARDLLIEAYSLTKSRDEQAKLLDLLEIFREYIEKGTLNKAISIIAL